jgi:hypothetical protein
MSDGDFICLFILACVVVFMSAFGGYTAATVATREDICREQFHGIPADDGKMCLSKDRKTVIFLF